MGLKNNNHLISKVIKTEVIYIASLFNEVLANLKQKPLFENKQFRIDELSSDSYLLIHSLNVSKKTRISFDIYNDGLTFYIDRTNEIPEWSFDFIKQNPDRVKMEIQNIFSSKIIIEYKGHRTTISLINSKGDIIQQFKYTEGLWLNIFSKKTIYEYAPLFET